MCRLRGELKGGISLSKGEWSSSIFRLLDGELMPRIGSWRKGGNSAKLCRGLGPTIPLDSRPGMSHITRSLYCCDLCS